MRIKTYKTRELKGFSLHLMINGSRVHITFRRGCTLGSTATYTTSDKDIQDALESLPSFGPTFYIAKSEVIGDEAETHAVESTPVVEEEKEVVDILDAQTFKNIVELRRALQDKGIDVSQVTNVKAAETLAKKNGYNYTVEKNA
jgi:hypothetical protein